MKAAVGVMKMKAKLFGTVAGLMLVGTGSQAGAVTLNYFSEAVATVSTNTVDTGQIASPTAQATNPVTSVLGTGGSSSASANRSTGELHAADGPTTAIMNSAGFPGAAVASFGDTLTFTVVGAGPTTITNVGFTVHLDGTLGQINNGISGLAGVELIAVLGSTCCVSMGAFSPTASNNIINPSTGVIIENFYGTPSIIDQDFSAYISFTGPTATVPLFMTLDAFGQYAFSDFGNTATFSFNTLPSGVSFTSASGDFLSPTPVPGPIVGAGLPGLLAGFGAMLAWYGRRRAIAA
jgi:hypothetical protein